MKVKYFDTLSIWKKQRCSILQHVQRALSFSSGISKTIQHKTLILQSTYCFMQVHYINKPGIKQYALQTCSDVLHVWSFLTEHLLQISDLTFQVISHCSGLTRYTSPQSWKDLQRRSFLNVLIEMNISKQTKLLEQANLTITFALPRCSFKTATSKALLRYFSASPSSVRWGRKGNITL